MTRLVPTLSDRKIEVIILHLYAILAFLINTFDTKALYARVYSDTNEQKAVIYLDHSLTIVLLETILITLAFIHIWKLLLLTKLEKAAKSQILGTPIYTRLKSACIDTNARLQRV